MRSQLTRNAYRRLLAGYGYLVRPCSSSPASLTALRPRLDVHLAPAHCLVIRRPSRRTFFGVFQKAPRSVKEPEIEPGYTDLLQFRATETENGRPPPRADLIHGLRQFLRYKQQHQKALNTTQAFLTLRLLTHLVEAPSEHDVDDLTLEDLRLAMEIVAKPPRGPTEHHLELAKLVYQEIQRRDLSTPDIYSPDNTDVDADNDVNPADVPSPDTPADKDFKRYISALTQYGASMEASGIVGEHLQSTASECPNRRPKDESLTKRDMSLHTMVMRGLAKEGREQELLNEQRRAEEAGVGYTPAIQECLVKFYAARGRVKETKHWADKPLKSSHLIPTIPTYMELSRFAVRNDEAEWLNPIFERLINRNPSKARWDTIFHWAVLVMDKGVEGVKQMISTMVQHNQEEVRSNVRPDADLIDTLIIAAIEKKSPYLAERFLSLGADFGIAPQTSTYVLQMDYRLDANDISGAHAVYEKLRNFEGEEIWTPSSVDDVSVFNKYIRTLCAAAAKNNNKPADTERILDITGELEQRRVPLEPETIVSLCMTLLRGDQQLDVIDTLSLHTVSYSFEEREKVRRAFVDYILDTSVSTARVWDAYALLRQFFPETDPEDRIRLMHAFFARKRPDMACYIFGHMRAHANMAQRPDADLYVACLEGLGRHPHAESLQMVHNMLKMDTTVQLTTRVVNALMLAYAACGDADTAMGFWSGIENSAEGPSYNSLAIVFYVCELLPFGDRQARPIWRKMLSMDLDVPPKVKQLMRRMGTTVGYLPSSLMIGIVYNALQWHDKRQNFVDFVKEEYPELWTQLESKGQTMKLSGSMFNIERNMKA
ncbi:putative complex I protein [Bombardia bombarda]|uniref:Complex I protein n=1 Tax=Bombardia bombarda TaxID=252184 RepID=A0AA39XL74_9PEZI|nr:putative complex I protein [Bombardia bombarda]